MQSPNEILTELLEIAPSLGKAGSDTMPYAVPLGYFDDFADILLYRIRFEGESFAETKSISASEEIAEISPLLAGLKNKNPFKVPSGFFENPDIKVPVMEKVPTKLTSLAGSVKTKKISIPLRIVRYAAAACIV